MPRSPDGVQLSRLVGGDFDGSVSDVEPGTDLIRIGGAPIGVWGDGPEDELEALSRIATYWEYRFSGEVRDGEDGPEAVFEFIRKIEEPLAGPSV